MVGGHALPLLLLPDVHLLSGRLALGEGVPVRPVSTALPTGAALRLRKTHAAFAPPGRLAPLPVAPSVISARAVVNMRVVAAVLREERVARVRSIVSKVRRW